ncbi:MAG: hypothetical protein HRT47_08600 [Candidatus Caenarcaniphilales bacterium]|nr:hypothetical protein [Candidatus Caenarcaniphilales bacterium]
MKSLEELINNKVVSINPNIVQPEPKNKEEELRSNIFKSLGTVISQCIPKLPNNINHKDLLKKSITLIDNLSQDLKNLLHFKFPEEKTQNLAKSTS